MDEMQEKYSDSFQNNKKVMDVEESKKKLVDDILKESLVNAQERAEVIVMIVNAVNKLTERIEELEKGKKRKVE